MIGVGKRVTVTDIGIKDIPNVVVDPEQAQKMKGFAVYENGLFMVVHKGEAYSIERQFDCAALSKKMFDAMGFFTEIFRIVHEEQRH